MIQPIIKKINDTIINSGLINRYGGYSLHKIDKATPYGVSLQKDCYGNTYSYDDRIETVGYLQLRPFTSKTRSTQLTEIDLQFVIHILNNTKISGEGQRFFSKALGIVSHLKFNGFDDVNVQTFDNVADKIEYATITINQKIFIPCGYVPEDLDSLCEGNNLYDNPSNPNPTIYPKNLSTHRSVSVNFDPDNPNNNLPTVINPRKLDTLIVQFTNGIGYYSYTTSWDLNFFVPFSVAILNKYTALLPSGLIHTIQASTHNIPNASNVDIFNPQGIKVFAMIEINPTFVRITADLDLENYVIYIY
jgi:hypothetical protein